MTANHAGRLLVSRPELSDPNFDGSVTLIIQHDESGAFGLVLNRPLELPVTDAFEGWEVLVGEAGLIYSGGPVETDSLIALGHSEDQPGGLVHGLHSVDLNESPVQAIAGGIVAVRIFAGYAGWGAGQLEGELASGAWWLVDAKPSDVFIPNVIELWPRVLKRGGGDMAWFAHVPDDPSLN